MEISTVLTFAAVVFFLSFFGKMMIEQFQHLFTTQFQSIAKLRISQRNIGSYTINIWRESLYAILPVFVVTTVVASASTLFQTKFNWSWKKLAPDFSRMNPIKGIGRMVSFTALVELAKSLAKLLAVGVVAFLILKSEWFNVPSLMRTPLASTWHYWGRITLDLFWAVSGLLLVIGAADYLFNFIRYERSMRMTKQEVKEEYKKREVDPHVKGRMRRMQRDMATKKTLDKTKQATVLITNPTHYTIAVRYELGMSAPVVVAKGIDYLALRMREIGKELDIPIVENKPLARTLYKVVEVGQEIPETLYKAVSEVIRYVFGLKGIKIQPKKSSQPIAG